MVIRNIDIDELKSYIHDAFIGDEEIVNYYDKSVNITCAEEAIENVIEKITCTYADANFFGVELHGIKVGYFVCTEELLISFGMNVKFRTSESLSEFWGFIKRTLGDSFQCVLYAHNSRGISFLQKGGMKILFENITILTNN